MNRREFLSAAAAVPLVGAANGASPMPPVAGALGWPVAWAPQPGSQTLFVACPVFECLYEGTRGPGKTNALLMDFCQHVGKGYGSAWRGVLFRRSYPALADVVTKAREWIPRAFPRAEFIQSGPSGYTWRFATGEQLLFRYIEKKTDYATYHGHEYPWVAFDELTMWESSDCYDVMKSCCRSSAPGLPRKYRATTNPHGPGHNWVKSRFIDAAPRGVVVTDDLGNQRVTLHGHWSENRYLVENDPDYVNRLLQATEDDPDQQAAWVDGSWDVSAGTYFGAVWSRRHAVLPSFEIPGSWRIDRAFDWGSSKPFSVGWWAESDGCAVRLKDGSQRTFVRGSLFRIGEYYGMQRGKPNVGLGLTAGEIATEIKRQQKERWPRRLINPGPADSSIFDVQDGHCIGDSFRHAGITWLPANKGPGSRKNGWQLMRERFKATRPKLDAENRPLPLENAGLFVFDTCTDFIRTVPMLPRDPKNADDIDTGAEDHIADEARYRVLAAPVPTIRSSSMSM